MITSERQLNTTKKKIVSLKESLAEMKKSASGVLGNSTVIQTEALTQELESEVLEYEKYLPQKLKKPDSFLP